LGISSRLKKRNLFNSAVTPKSAQIFNRNFYPQYGPEYLLKQPKFTNSPSEGLSPNPIHSPENDKDISYNEDSSLSVPFLLSNNMEYFIGPTAIHGIFSTVMLASVLTLGDTDLLVQVKDRLRLYFQNDLVDWAQHYRSDIPSEELIEKIEANTNSIASKILSLTPEIRADVEVESSVPINTPVVELLNAALDADNASKLDTTYFLWF